MGEENEVLRNLLTDTGRKIGELDELKEAFDKIVAPFNSALRALEQEKSQTLGLTGMLDEVARGLRDAAHRILPDRDERRPRSKPRRRSCAIDLELARESEPRARKHAPRTLQRNLRPHAPDHRARAPAGAGNRAAPYAEREPPHAAGAVRRRREAQHGARGRACRRAREAGAAGRREALAANRGRSGVQRNRPPHPPAHREREHADRDPRPARQGRGQLRGSLCRTRPARRRARRDPRAAPGRAQQPEHAARCLAVARRHGRALAVRGAAEPDRPHRGSARLRPQVGGSDHRPQQRREAARPDRG